ncbi:MAG: PIG-L family deacetylase [Anaerolineae bacterium]|nr:PIG-L family deacetylase [Anaerolineae bacterium]
MLENLTAIPVPERVLIVYAHPDDAEFFAGGTLAKWAQAGAHLTLLLVTSGDKGSGDLTLLDGQQLARQREAESHSAARRLGIQEVIFLRGRDGEQYPNLALRRHIARFIRLKQPDAVMSSDPLLRYRDSSRANHPDHYAVAEAVLNAVFPAARDHLNFPELFRDEGLAPYKVAWLYLALALEPNYRVDVTDTWQDKVEALQCHASQVGEPAAFAERMRDRFDPIYTLDAEHPRYVEHFRVLKLA